MTEKQKINSSTEEEPILKKDKSKLDRHEFIMDSCIIVLTLMASCTFIAETIAIVIGIVSS